MTNPRFDEAWINRDMKSLEPIEFEKRMYAIADIAAFDFESLELAVCDGRHFYS